MLKLRKKAFGFVFNGGIEVFFPDKNVEFAPQLWDHKTAQLI